MSPFSILTFLLFGCIAPDVLATLRNKRSDGTSNIIGGSEVEPGSLPYMVALYLNNTEGENHFHCGGAIISNYHVLTAGHCVKGWHAERFTVIAGAHNLSSPLPTQVTVQVAEVTVQDLFYWEDHSAIPVNDVALLRLSEPLTFGEGVGPVLLPQQDNDPAVAEPCTVAGWGSTEEGGPLSDVLMSVDVPVVEQEYCIDSFDTRIKNTMMCAGYPLGQMDACAGDSGGPLICEGVVQGIVSWGVGCGQVAQFGVYARVAYFRDWIEKHNYVPQ